jgi:hypothetical protein
MSDFGPRIEAGNHSLDTLLADLAGVHVITIFIHPDDELHHVERGLLDAATDTTITVRRLDGIDVVIARERLVELYPAPTRGETGNDARRRGWWTRPRDQE